MQRPRTLDPRPSIQFSAHWAADENGREEGGRYNFHDFRRAFATMNCESFTGDALQRLMRHKDYSTTQRNVFVPSVLKKASGE